MSFFGFRLMDMHDFGTGIKLGMMYKAGRGLTLAASWNSQVNLDLEGRMLVDMSPSVWARLNTKCQALNIDQPGEFGVGAALQATDRLLLAIELNWINWSDAVTTGVITGSAPDNAAAPVTLESATDNNWRDQRVFAAGIAYKWNDSTLIRAGYNYCRNPIPDQYLNPLLNTIAKHHLTFGLGYTLDPTWSVDGAFEWDIRSCRPARMPSRSASCSRCISASASGSRRRGASGLDLSNHRLTISEGSIAKRTASNLR